MKQLLTIFLATLFLNIIGISAQDTTHMLFNFKNMRPNYVGLYVAPEVQVGQLNSSFTSFGGGSAMLLLNRKWGIGVSAYQSLNDSYSPKGVAPKYLKAFFGGIRLEYSTNPTSIVHLTFPLLIGMGMAHADSLKNENRGHGYDNDNNDRNGINDHRNGNESFVVQPGIQVEANLLRYIKLFAGANYRVAFTDGTSTIPKNTFNGLSLNLGTKIGLFDYKLGKKKTEE